VRTQKAAPDRYRLGIKRDEFYSRPAASLKWDRNPAPSWHVFPDLIDPFIIDHGWFFFLFFIYNWKIRWRRGIFPGIQFGYLLLEGPS